MRRESIDRREPHEAPGDRALSDEDERRRPGNRKPRKSLPYLQIEGTLLLFHARGNAEPDGADRPYRSRNSLNCLGGRAVGRNRDAREHSREHGGGDGEPERGHEHSAVSAAHASPGEPRDVPGGAHATPRRRRYAAVLTRFPQMDIEHQFEERLREAS